MNKPAVYFSIIFLMLISTRSFSQLTVTTLKCEYLINPIGIDDPNPRFVWQLVSDKPGAMQQAFQLIVGTDESAPARLYRVAYWLLFIRTPFYKEYLSEQFSKADIKSDIRKIMR